MNKPTRKIVPADVPTIILLPMPILSDDMCVCVFV